MRQRKDGSRRAVRVSAAGVPGEDGGALVLYDDVSEARQDEARLRDALRDARRSTEDATAAKGVFLLRGKDGGEPYVSKACSRP